MQECFRILPLSFPWEKLLSELFYVELWKWKREGSEHKKKDRSFTYLSRVTESRGRTPPFPVCLRIIPINSVLCSLISQQTLKWNSVASEATAKVRSMVDIWKSRQLSIAKTPLTLSYSCHDCMWTPSVHTAVRPYCCPPRTIASSNPWLVLDFKTLFPKASAEYIYICFHLSFIST